jgi:hypothetical protein
MRSEAELPEPLADIGSFHIDHNLYGEISRIHLQDALRTLHGKIISIEEDSYCLVDLESFMREHPRKFDRKIIDTAFEIFELPIESEAFSQSRMDALEEAREEVRAVVENMGTPNLSAVLNNVLNSRKTKYIVKLSSHHFLSETNPEGVKEFSFDFTDKLEEDLKKELHMSD